MSFSQEALSKSDNEQESLNDLKEFGVDTNEPDLFSSENQSLNSEDSIISPDVEEEEDDLEIPAFLRRHKINGLVHWKPPWYRMLQNIIRTVKELVSIISTWWHIY